VASVATPALFNEIVFRVVVPSVNVAEPVGVPVPDDGVTVAVKVTDWPVVMDEADAVNVVVVFVSEPPVLAADENS
jgi:hypothetical protein